MRLILLSVFVIALFTITIVSEGVSLNLRHNSAECSLISANEKLTNYFRLHETTPAQITNNIDDPGRWESRKSIVSIGRHKVEWIDKVTKTTSTSTLKIDGHPIRLEGIQSTNPADGQNKIDLNDVGRWEQIKLYQLGEQKLIGITMRPKICTGLSCGVAAQLLFDLKTKQVTFFGTFRAEDEVRLFRLTNDGVYYLSKKHEGDPHGTMEFSITYNAYRLNADGTFDLEKDRLGKPFYLKHTIFPVDIEPYTLRKLSEEKPDRLEQHWIEKID